MGPDRTEVVWFSQADDCDEAVWRPVGELVCGFYRENLQRLKQLAEAQRQVRSLF